MATARFKDLVTLVIDVGPTAHAAAPAWPEVVQRIMANRMIVDKPHMELAIIAYGSDTTHNALWDPSSPDEYKGIHVITEYCPCKADVFETLPAKLAPGGGPSDHYWALVAAADLLVRTVTDRKLQAARKSIIVASPFAAEVPAVGEPMLKRLFESLAAVGAPTVSAAVVAWPHPSPPPAAAANLALFRTLHRAGAAGAIEHLAAPHDLFTLARTHSAGTMFQNVLKVGEFEVNVKTGKLVAADTMPAFRPYVGDACAPDPEAFLKKESTQYLKDGDPRTDAVEAEEREKSFRFGADYFPAQLAEAYKWQAQSAEAAFKGLQVLCFVRDTWSPRDDDAEDEEEALTDQGPWAVVPATAKAAHTLSALVRAARSRRRLALVRMALTTNSTISLGVLVPVVATGPHDFDCFHLYKVAWGNELRTVALPVLDDDAATALGVAEGHLDAAEAFVRARAAPAGARLPCDASTDPARNCAAMAMVRAGLLARAGALTASTPIDGLDGDALVRAVLLPRREGDDDAAKSLRKHFPDAAAPADLPDGAPPVAAVAADVGEAAAGVKSEPSQAPVVLE